MTSRWARIILSIGGLGLLGVLLLFGLEPFPAKAALPATQGFAMAIPDPPVSRDLTQHTLTVLVSAAFICLAFTVLYSRRALAERTAELERLRGELASMRQKLDAQARRLAQAMDMSRTPTPAAEFTPRTPYRGGGSSAVGHTAKPAASAS